MQQQSNINHSSSDEVMQYLIESGKQHLLSEAKEALQVGILPTYEQYWGFDSRGWLRKLIDKIIGRKYFLFNQDRREAFIVMSAMKQQEYWDKFFRIVKDDLSVLLLEADKNFAGVVKLAKYMNKIAQQEIEMKRMLSA